MLFAAPAEANRTGASAEIQATLSLIKNHNDPVAKKLLTWIYATETPLLLRPAELMAFLRENPDWPKRQAMKEKIEQSIGGILSASETTLWFSQNPPSTYDGIKAYAEALKATGHEEQAKQALQVFWRDMPLKRNETALIAGAYAKYFTPAQHSARLDKLIWQGRLNEAEYMLAFVPSDIRALGHARIALAQMSPKAEMYLQQVPPALSSHEGLVYERLRYRRRKRMDSGALEMAALMPAHSSEGEKWWEEINILARREIEQKHYRKAYDIAGMFKGGAPREVSQAEWLRGWLAHLQKKPAQAYTHFTNMYSNVESSISRSRGAYWAAVAAGGMHDKEQESYWHQVAAQYPTTFYGQLSLAKTKTRAVIHDAAVDPAAWQAFGQKETVRAARLLFKLKLTAFIDPFLARLNNDASNLQDYAMVARLAQELERPRYAVQANKDAQQKLGQALFRDGYPVLPLLPSPYPEKSLVHAITYRESMFDRKARSSAGALGLMQLMPATARQTAEKLGRPYNRDKLTEDPRYNTLLGSTFLQQLIDRYNGSYVLAIAAYNAGPGRAREWIENFGDPRDAEVDMIDWIEHIPIYETRNYVQRVMETYYIYRLHFEETPYTVIDNWHR